MKLASDWLARPETIQLSQVLTDAGHQAWFVGGCVRNSFLSVEVHDIDVATDAAPDKVMALAKARGFQAIPTGIEHGTVTVVVNKIPFEITTFRKDIETDGRHAVVRFADNLTDDAQRRDFTMNALYVDIDGNIVDPENGLPDLKNRYVRFIGDPMDRIREDYLRILRFFRFLAIYGDKDQGPDPHALAACAELADGLDQISAERITSEVLKLLGANDPAPALASMQATGVLWRVLAGADSGTLAVLVHLENTLSIAPKALRRLAMIDRVAAYTALRLSKAQSRYLVQMDTVLATDVNLEEIAYRYGAEFAVDCGLIRCAQMNTLLTQDNVTGILTAAQQIFPLGARDLMPELQGPALGEALKCAEAAWIKSGFRTEKEQLIEIALNRR